MSHLKLSAFSAWHTKKSTQQHIGTTEQHSRIIKNHFAFEVLSFNPMWNVSAVICGKKNEKLNKWHGVYSTFRRRLRERNKKLPLFLLLLLVSVHIIGVCALCSIELQPLSKKHWSRGKMWCMEEALDIHSMKCSLQYTKWFVFFTLSLCPFRLFYFVFEMFFFILLFEPLQDFNEITMHFIGFSNRSSLFWFRLDCMNITMKTAHPPVLPAFRSLSSSN